MSHRVKYAIIAVLALGLAVLGGFVLLHGSNLPVLQPKGTIAAQERQLIYLAVGLSVLVVVPVFAMTIAIIWKYRAGNTKATYSPEWDHSRAAETVWWVVPSLLILALSVITWQQTHQLDPATALVSEVPAMTIRVVALDWKWLFIYPRENIATVNYVRFPAGTPVNFEITSDAPMNSFWIPSLGGQIYAMPGMITHLQLEADASGTYTGSSANISGRGFAGMHFMAESSTEADFSDWVNTVKQSPNSLTATEYTQLARPSQDVTPTYYAYADSNLYDEIVMKFMMPTTQLSHSHMPGMVMP